MESQFGPYRKLLKRAHQIALFAGASELLSWDEETYMPPKALDFRAEELACLCGHSHRLFTAKTTGQWLAECEQHGFAPDSPEAANVREWRRRYDRATKIPARLVEKFERTRAHAREAWKKARQESNYKIFKPHLQKLVELNRQRADAWGYQESPYDALLDEYGPGMRSVNCDPYLPNCARQSARSCRQPGSVRRPSPRISWRVITRWPRNRH